MLVGIITDIHNNITALKDIIGVLQKHNCQKIICCGDIIGIGPYPEETVQFLMQIPNLVAVRGNHENYLLGGIDKAFSSNESMTEEEYLYHKWEHEKLSDESVNFLRSLPMKQELCLEGHNISVIHYGTDDCGEFLRAERNPTDGELDRIFAKTSGDIVLFGHEHYPQIRKIGARLFINVGSLGCPGREKNIARAGLLSLNNNQPEIQPIAIEYDASNVVESINRLHYPAFETVKKFFFGVGRNDGGTKSINNT